MAVMSSEAESRPAGQGDRWVDPRDLKWNYSVIEGGIPVAVFWVANNLGPSQLAIILSFIAAFIVFMRNRDSGVVRALSILGFVIVAGSAAAGLILESGKAFAAQNIVSDIAFVIIGIVSLAIGKPFVGPIARELVPAIKPLIANADSVFVLLTVLNILMNVIQAVARIWLIDVLSTNDYVILSRVLSIPLNVAYFGFAYWAIMRRIAREAPPPGEPA